LKIEDTIQTKIAIPLDGPLTSRSPVDSIMMLLASKFRAASGCVGLFELTKHSTHAIADLADSWDSELALH
jgi:hypothetical protein